MISEQKETLGRWRFSEQQKRQCSQELCFLCLYHKGLISQIKKLDVLGIDNKNVVMQTIAGFYCSKGHLKQTLNCKDFETTPYTVKNMIINHHIS